MSTRPPVPLILRLFGPFEAQVNGRPLPRLHSRKGQWLLALLALRVGREVDRDWLAGTLWPEHPEAQALASLRNSLTDLRKALGLEAGRLRAPTTRTLFLDLTGAQVDVVAFDTAVAGGDGAMLAEAVALYRGPLLEECSEAWALEERQAREETYLRARETLAAHALESDDPEAAAQHLRRVVAANPLRERAQRALMQALAAGGNYAAALLSYRELRLLLHRELNAEPDPETRALFESLRARAKPSATQTREEGFTTETRRHGEKRTEEDQKESPASPRSLSVFSSVSPCLRGESSPTVLEPVGGAVPLDSPFYVVRPTDAEFHAAIARQDSIVLVKGARQTGKTSLLARGLHQARQTGASVLLTDFQLLNAAQLAAAETLLLGLAEWIASQLDLEVPPAAVWNPRHGPNVNFQQYLRRQVLEPLAEPLVWGLDDVDRLFRCDFGSEIFAMFRAWHNARSLDPSGPWSRLTLAIAYATEHHLFVTDINQSPFNVGTRLTLADFTVEQVVDLNRRYGSPLGDAEEAARFHRLLGGHPYLVRLGLHEMATHGLGLATIEAERERDEGIFGDHLRRMRLLLVKDADLCAAVRAVLQGEPCPTAESFYRLRSAGVLTGDSMRTAQPRCPLYASYLERHLP